MKENVHNLNLEKEQLENRLEELEHDIEEAELKLERAKKLTGLLKSEKVRWK